MTPAQQERYEHDRADAQAVYQRLMMESNAVVIRAREPATPLAPKPLFQRIWQTLRKKGCP